MRVEFCKSIEVEAEVQISVDEITQALAEECGEALATSASKHETDRSKVFTATRFISDVLQCLGAVSAPMIEGIREPHRALIAYHLRKQAARYATAKIGQVPQPSINRLIADQIARDLFTNGNGDFADRLVFELRDGGNGGGWAFGPMVNRIEKKLEEIEVRQITDVFK